MPEGTCVHATVRKHEKLHQKNIGLGRSRPYWFSDLLKVLHAILSPYAYPIPPSPMSELTDLDILSKLQERIRRALNYWIERELCVKHHEVYLLRNWKELKPDVYRTNCLRTYLIDVKNTVTKLISACS